MGEPDAAAYLRAAEQARDLEPVWLTRGQLKEIVQRVLVAEGMSIKDAKIHADARVSSYVNNLNSIERGG